MDNYLNKNKAIILTSLTVLIGGILTIVLTVLFKNHLLRFLTLIESYLDEISLIIGTIATFFVSTLVYFHQVAKHRAEVLDKTNHELKLEIEERIAVQESKQKLEAGMLQEQKLQAIGTLAGGIAHDFNNILYAINGYAELVKADLATDSLPYKNVTKILDGCGRGKD